MADAMLVGSANVENAEELFRLIGETSPQTFARIPDGERGRRRNWLAAQGPFLASNDTLEGVETGPNRYGSRGQVGKRFKPKDGVALDAIELDLPYAEDAADSFATFRALKDDGVLPAGMRMQICMPTAMATCLALIAPEAQREMLPVVERALGDQVSRILVALPHDGVAIQWDVAAEFMHMELAGASTFSQDEIVAALARLARPGTRGRSVRLPPLLRGRASGARREGQALRRAVRRCAARGDRQRRHGRSPASRRLDPHAGADQPRRRRLLRTARGPAACAPDAAVPRPRARGGRDGGRAARAAAASKFVTGFGVATECGMQNEPRDAHPTILEIQRDLAVPA